MGRVGGDWRNGRILCMVNAKLEARLVWEGFHGTMYHETVPTPVADAECLGHDPVNFCGHQLHHNNTYNNLAGLKGIIVVGLWLKRTGAFCRSLVYLSFTHALAYTIMDVFILPFLAHAYQRTASDGLILYASIPTPSYPVHSCPLHFPLHLIGVSSVDWPHLRVDSNAFSFLSELFSVYS